jgi:hypothetical protein
VNIYFAVVVNEAQVAEFVHEEADAGSCRPNHFRKRLLIEDDRNDGRANPASQRRSEMLQTAKADVLVAHLDISIPPRSRQTTA